MKKKRSTSTSISLITKEAARFNVPSLKQIVSYSTSAFTANSLLRILEFKPGIILVQKLAIEVLPHHPSSFQTQGKLKIPTLPGTEPGIAAFMAVTVSKSYFRGAKLYILRILYFSHFCNKFQIISTEGCVVLNY